MNQRTYFLAVYEAPEGGYTCSFPDFECVVDQGETLAETVAHARELLAFQVNCMVEQGQALPVPSEGAALRAKLKQPPYCLVPVDVYPPMPSGRINITAPDAELAEITDYARRNHISRSRLMVDSTLKFIRANA